MSPDREWMPAGLEPVAAAPPVLDPFAGHAGRAVAAPEFDFWAPLDLELVDPAPAARRLEPPAARVGEPEPAAPQIARTEAAPSLGSEAKRTSGRARRAGAVGVCGVLLLAGGTLALGGDAEQPVARLEPVLLPATELAVPALAVAFEAQGRRDRAEARRRAATRKRADRTHVQQQRREATAARVAVATAPQAPPVPAPAAAPAARAAVPASASSQRSANAVSAAAQEFAP